jgi:hypothetical protein
MPDRTLAKRLLLFGLLVISGMSTREAPAQAVVLLKCEFYNGRVDRLRIEPDAKRAEFLNGGTFALEISENFYTLTGKVDLGAAGGVVDLETKIDRRSDQVTTRIVGLKRYLLGGVCFGDQPR